MPKGVKWQSLDAAAAQELGLVGKPNLQILAREFEAAAYKLQHTAKRFKEALEDACPRAAFNVTNSAVLYVLKKPKIRPSSALRMYTAKKTIFDKV